jgi:hypothetical protein
MENTYRRRTRDMFAEPRHGLNGQTIRMWHRSQNDGHDLDMVTVMSRHCAEPIEESEPPSIRSLGFLGRENSVMLAVSFFWLRSWRINHSSARFLCFYLSKPCEWPSAGWGALYFVRVPGDEKDGRGNHPPRNCRFDHSIKRSGFEVHTHSHTQLIN